jgi:hypothetical protein
VGRQSRAGAKGCGGSDFFPGPESWLDERNGEEKNINPPKARTRILAFLPLFLFIELK